MAPTLTDRQTPEADLYLLACLMLAQFILTLLGVASLLISCLLGLFLMIPLSFRSPHRPVPPGPPFSTGQRGPKPRCGYSG